MTKFLTAFIFVFILFFTLHTSAQMSPGVLAGKLIVSSIIGSKEKRQEKTIEKSESKETVNGTSVTILRVKDADIKSKAKAYIIKVQNSLDEYAELCKMGLHLNIPKKDSDMYHIQTLDADWPTGYYENELKVYKKYELKLMQHEKDSVAAVKNMQIKRENDSLVLAKKSAVDTIANVSKVQAYNYLNKAFAIIKETPANDAKTLGVLYVGSYVTLLNPTDKSPFVKISFKGGDGFIDKSFLVDSIDKITVPNADLNTYKKSVYCRYAAKPQ